MKEKLNHFKSVCNKKNATDLVKSFINETPEQQLTSEQMKLHEDLLQIWNNSGELVPKATTVKPITIWGIPRIKDKATDPWIKNSPPIKSKKIPTIISTIENKYSLILYRQLFILLIISFN